MSRNLLSARKAGNNAGKESHPLDAAGFDPVDFINQTFPTEASLAGVDALVAQLNGELRDLDRFPKTAVSLCAKFFFGGSSIIESHFRIPSS